MKKTLLALFLIIVLGGLLRLSFLGQNPPGLNNDEADIGYDAYSILKTGKDQWGTILPLFSFKGFGDYRLPLYTYLVVPSEAVFGVNEFAVRFPSALAGILTIFFVFVLAKELFDKKVGLTAAFLLAISSWHIAMSRVGIESNVAILGIVLTMYFALLGKRKGLRFIFLSLLFFILSFYTYYSARVVLPLLLIFYFLLYHKSLLVYKKHIFFCVLIAVFLFLPSLGVQNRLSQIGLTKDSGLVDTINEERGACQQKLPGFICQFSSNKPTAYLSQFFINYFNHYSIDLLFLHGSDTSLGVMNQRGFFYLLELPLLLTGLVILLVKRSKENILLLVWFLVAPLADSLTSGGHYSRMLTFLPVMEIIEALGFMEIYNEFKKRATNPLLKPLPIILVSVILLISLSAFSIKYYTYYPRFFSRSSLYGYKQLFGYLHEKKTFYNQIYISNRFYDTKQYIFYLFFTKYDPVLYQNNVYKNVSIDSDGWVWVNKIDNINFISTVSQLHTLETKSLIVANPGELPKNIKQEKAFYDLKGDALFSLVTSETLLKYESNKPNTL